MTWKQLIADAASQLERAGVEDAKLNAEYLALHALGLWQRSELLPFLEREAEQIEEYRALVDRRAGREPLQYIIGEWEFYGLRLHTTAAALIPRPETELLVHEALTLVQPNAHLLILDIGTGTGAIALALASQLPTARVVGMDISRDAIELAERNSVRLGVTNVTFMQTDILARDLSEYELSVDLLVSNPPYVSASDYGTIEPELTHEPRIAITDEGSGLRFYERIISLSNALLKPDGYLVFELGYDVRDGVERLAREAGLTVERVVKDFNGIDRVLVARRPVTT